MSMCIYLSSALHLLERFRIHLDIVCIIGVDTIAKQLSYAK